MARLPDSLRAHRLAPVHPGEPARVDRRGEARNPICRDHVIVYLQLDGDRIEAAGFRATGCPAAMAYASAACEWLTGRALTGALPAEILAALSAAHGDPGAARRHALAMVERCVAACALPAATDTARR